VIVSPTTAVACVLVKVVPLIAAPEALAFALIVPPVTVKPVVTSETVKVNQRPFAAVGKVHEGLPLVERLLNTWPDCAAVSATVAPTSALSVTVRRNDPVGIPAVNTGAAVKVATPVNVLVPPTAKVAAVPDSVTGSLVFVPPVSLMAGRYFSMYRLDIVFSP